MDLIDEAGQIKESRQFEELASDVSIKLLRARAFYEAMAKQFSAEEEAWPFLAWGGRSLAEAYLWSGQLAEAQKLYRSFEAFGHSPLVQNCRAKTAASLIAFLNANGRLAESEETFRELSAMGDSDAIVAERARGAFYLTTVASQAMRPELARAYYDVCLGLAEPYLRRGRAPLTLVPAKGWAEPKEAPSPGLSLVAKPAAPAGLAEVGDVSETIAQTVAKASVNMISCYANCGLVDEGIAIYDLLAAMGLKDERGHLPRSASDLVFACAKAGRWREARHFYDTIVINSEGLPQYYRVKSAANLVVFYAEAGFLVDAQEMARELNLVGLPSFYRKEKSRAINGLIEAFLAGERYDEAVDFYLALREWKNGFSLGARAVAAGHLLRGLAQKGRLAQARRVFNDFSRYQALKGYIAEKALAALDLVEGYARALRFEEAQVLHESLISLPNSDEIALTKARSYFVLTTALALDSRLDEAKAAFMGLGSLAPTPSVETEKSKTMVNLISCLGSADRLPEAVELFRQFPQLMASDAVIYSQAQAAYNLVCDHVWRGQLGKAQEFLEFLGQLGQSEAIADLRAAATLETIQGAIRIGRLKVAEKAYATLAAGQGSMDSQRVRVKAGVQIINAAAGVEAEGQCLGHFDLNERERLDLARYVFVTLDGLTIEEGALGAWAGALVNLGTALESAGFLSEAQRIFESMARLGESPEVLGELAKASFNRITFRLEAGKLEEALALLKEMELLADKPAVRPRLAQVMVNVVSVLGQAGWLPEAQSVYERSTLLGSEGQTPVYRAKTLFNLFLGYFNAGYLAVAAELFVQFRPGPELSELSPNLMEAAMELILDLVEAGLMEEARAVNATMSAVLAEDGLTNDWAAFETLVQDPLTTPKDEEKLSRLFFDRLRETVQDLKEGRKSQEFELAEPGSPSAEAAGEVEGRSPAKSDPYGLLKPTGSLTSEFASND
ncbi:MAG: hypothetical protein LBE01_05130 [Deltaproteobacteria bacterium]|nr:hypothetical protein [Deltaproteobacteria bacterium]